MRHLGGLNPAQPPQIRESQIDAATRKAADELAEWARPKTPKRKKGIGNAAFVRTLDEATAMLKDGDWASAKPSHFVALYADLHFRVYGVEASELGSKERVYAAGMATKLLAEEFGNDRNEMAKYVAWTWSREKGREKWRRETGNHGGRVTWQLQFGKGKFLTEFRLEEARKKTR